MRKVDSKNLEHKLWNRILKTQNVRSGTGTQNLERRTLNMERNICNVQRGPQNVDLKPWNMAFQTQHLGHRTWDVGAVMKKWEGAT